MMIHRFYNHDKICIVCFDIFKFHSSSYEFMKVRNTCFKSTRFHELMFTVCEYQVYAFGIDNRFKTCNIKIIN